MTATKPRHLIDFHTHAFPEKVAERAMAALIEMFGIQPVTHPTVEGLHSIMAQAGVDVSVIWPVATRPDQVKSINDWAAQNTSEQLICFGSLHPGLDDPVAEVERIIGMGFKGAKLQPNFQEFVPDDPKLCPIYEAAQGRLILAFHSGQEIALIDHVYATPASIARVREAFPNLTMVVAHMGGERMWDEVKARLAGHDLYLDTSYCLEEDLSDEAMLDLIRTHGAERILFATDFPWGHPKKDLSRLMRLGLTQEEIEAITWRNASNLLGLGFG